MCQFHNLTETYKKKLCFSSITIKFKILIENRKKEEFVLFQELSTVTLEINE